MLRRTPLLLMIALAGSLCLPAADEETNITFKSDVALVRVDVQVLDRDNRAITGLKASDFILTEQGKRQEIRNFSTENMPLDVLFLLDVSASMRPHIQRISDAAHQAFQVLGKEDRIGIMIFDTNARVRMPLKMGVRNAEDGLERVLDQENFRGGTHITDGLLEAASYLRREGRKDARKAIIIVTDDMSQDKRDEASVNRALTRADAVLCALIAPDAMQQRGRGGYPGGGGGGMGGGRGGMGGGIGGLGGIILGGGGMGGGRGGRGGYGGNRGGYGGQGNHSAGTREIARSSGGDDMPVQDADSLETTLSRLRHRYALHFYAPAGTRQGEERTIDVQLASAAIRRYPDADVRFRRVYLSPGGGNGTPAVSDDSGAPAVITRSPATSDPDLTDRPVVRRRPMVDGSGGRSDGPLRYPDSEQSGSSSSATPASGSTDTPATDSQKSGGWRRVSPSQQP